MDSINMKKNSKFGNILVFAKYGFSIILIILATYRLSYRYSVMALLELACVFIISNTISDRRIRWILNSLMMLLLNVQMALMIYGHSYLTLIYLENVRSIQDLSGRVFTYLLTVTVVIFLSFLPVKRMKIKAPYFIVYVIIIFSMEMFALIKTSGIYSPFFAYYNLGKQIHNQQEVISLVKQIEVKPEEFYKESIKDYISMDPNLPASPNIVLIFTEGLSQQIVEDDRNIMPNVEFYEQNSLKFNNYYNQTAATYRGLRSQLYSGYQLLNYDKNGSFTHKCG